jgi:hypothetical protein
VHLWKNVGGQNALNAMDAVAVRRIHETIEESQRNMNVLTK